jgi:hypothetical protein
MTPSKLAQASKARAQVSPAAWLDQMAADAGHLHLHRLAELRGVLEAHARARDLAPLAAELEALAQAMPRLDFGLLQARGWWARTTGKGRSEGAEFAARFGEIDAATRQLAVRTQAMQKTHQAEAAATERALVEVEVEWHAIDKIVEQGGRWLQDMRSQLKARHTEAVDEQVLQQVRDDAARCEILVTRLKLLQGVVKAAQEAHSQAQALAAARAALLRMLQQALASDVKAWQVRLSALAASAGEGKSSSPQLEGPMETHRELELCVRQAGADCAALRTQERELAASVAALGQQLEAAA